MKIYMLRHGETDWNKGHRFQGQIDIPLNDYGRELAVVTRDSWPIIAYDRVYCSPLCRAAETARIVLEGRPELDKICYDDRIKEFSFGVCEGQNIDEAGNNPEHPMYNLLHHPENYVPQEGGESFDQLIGRGRSFIEAELLPLEKQGVQNVLIVAHGALIRGLVCAFGLKEVKDFWRTRYTNCCLTTIDITDGVATMVKEAETFYDASGHFGGWITQ